MMYWGFVFFAFSSLGIGMNILFAFPEHFFFFKFSPPYTSLLEAE